MTVKTAHWDRTLELEFWSKGEERSLIRILSPKKEKKNLCERSLTNMHTVLHFGFTELR